MAEIRKRVKTYLVLATGKVFEGWGFGALQTRDKVVSGGEVIFNTSLTGYQEILTDPSYKGQIVVMTASHIGNYGINVDDVESGQIYLSGFVVQERSPITSNWRATGDLDTYLKKHGTPALSGVDTRALTLHLRTQGAVNGVIATAENHVSALLEKAKALPRLEGQDLVKDVTSKKTTVWTGGTGSADGKTGRQDDKKKVVVMDFGVKRNILRCLVDLNCEVTVVPAATPASEILNLKPDGILASNGPGDPAMVKYGIQTLKDLIAHDKTRWKMGKKGLALFGICLGHQLMSWALGGETYKLKFGHHGANHPVKNLETGRVDITTQNHGFSTKGEKNSDGRWILKGNPDSVVTHVNLNDHSVEGIRHNFLPVFSVQHHPEASAGPHDARPLFERFIRLMESGRNKCQSAPTSIKS